LIVEELLKQVWLKKLDTILVKQKEKFLKMVEKNLKRLRMVNKLMEKMKLKFFIMLRMN